MTAIALHQPRVRVINAGPLTSYEDGGRTIWIVRAELDPISLTAGYDLTLEADVLAVLAMLEDVEKIGAVCVPEYQRGFVGGKKPESLRMYLSKGKTVPPLELGMRGYNWDDVGGNTYAFSDPVFVIDGLQRLRGYRDILLQNALNAILNLRDGFTEGHDNFRPQTPLPPLGVTLYVGTDERFERERFDTINFEQKALGASSRIALLAKEFSGARTLMALTKDAPEFPLYGHVQWGETMRYAAGEFMTGRVLLMTVCELYGFRNTDIPALVARLEEHIEVIGLPTFIQDVTWFFTVIDKHEGWAFNTVNPKKRGGSPQIHHRFLTGLAMFFHSYIEFWEAGQLGGLDEKKLADRERVKKFREFQIDVMVRAALTDGTGPRKLKSTLYNHFTEDGAKTEVLTHRAKVTKAAPSEIEGA